MRRSKKQNQYLHAKRRFKERFGISLQHNRLQRIVRDIQEGRSVVVEVQSNRLTVHKIVIDDTTVCVVYDKHRKNIVTVLPPNAPQYSKKGVQS